MRKIIILLLLFLFFKDANAKYIDYELIEQTPSIIINEIQYDDEDYVPKKTINDKKRVMKLKVKIDDSSPTKYYIPNSFKIAVIELDKMLPEDVKKVILSKNNDRIEFIQRETLFFELGLFLEEIWDYKSDNSLSKQLQNYNIYKNNGYHDNYSIHWTLEVLLRGVYEYNNDPNYDVSALLLYYEYITNKIKILNSRKLPFEEIPNNCENHNNDIKTKWIEVEGTNIYLYRVELYYVQCADNKIMAYQLDRGWYYPSDIILNKLLK